MPYGGPSWLTPMHGVCKQNGASPFIRAAISTLLLKPFCAKGFGFGFNLLLANDQLKFVGYSFLGNTGSYKQDLQNRTKMEKIKLPVHKIYQY